MRYTITEIKLIEKLLLTVPRGVDGMLPYEELAAKPEWKKLIKVHSVGSLRGKLSKLWNKSLIPIKEGKDNLHHAYNYCPNCAMKLN